MSGVLRKRALWLGAGVIGVGLIAAGKLGPSKKQAVLWGMSGELDKVNSEVDKAKEEAFGYVLLSFEEIELAREAAFGRQAGGEALKDDAAR
ncbi:uncharacterized protein LY89DRAFT_740995 [Mollisia scopiformis]|uniref:Uncharacterized protein n=1 Tax=Mollisia scopiformis TaxID=149040 RepID=A0A132BC83_MOLSC|nr:uncharacterized protein LY89DRAFT_740995 [Mollisia scopiformis]KUJ09267.1 hypothetical protein LY89DRAFT_740995 [Mollisia scopiformis]